MGYLVTTSDLPAYRLTSASGVQPTLERFASILAAERGRKFWESVTEMRLEVKPEDE